MSDRNISEIENSCRKLIESFGEKLSWKWDSRFETALAQFDVREKDWVHGIIQTQMDHVWDAKNKNNTPETVKAAIKCFGGLDSGQKLYTSAPDNDIIILCAWWPWGNGQTISIRLGFFAASLSDDANEGLTGVFKDWFNL